jgi:hypothetical protein
MMFGNIDAKKKNYIKHFIESFAANEAAMEPYKEQKRELRKEYQDNSWLTKDEIWYVIKAFRLYQKQCDTDDLAKISEEMEAIFGPHV